MHAFLLKAQSSIYTQNLRCEYLVHPNGIDELSPGLGWTLTTVDPHTFGQKQTAYRIISGYRLSERYINW
ncbi:glycoside hydrolase family 78 protein [Mucilaginibacter sabulilitoris]